MYVVAPDGTMTVASDTTIKIQTGPRPAAYLTLYQRVRDTVSSSRANYVVIKDSAISKGSANNALLHSAEARGVVMAAAAASSNNVLLVSKASISKRANHRNVDDYIDDETYWNLVAGELRKGSREIAVLMIALIDGGNA